MQSVQESKNELEASIRYAENAISSAKQTIESMEFRQEMAKKNYQEQTGREQALQAQVKLLEERIADMQSDMVGDAATIKKLRDEKEASSGPCGCQAYRDLEEARGRAEGEVELLQSALWELESKVQGQYDDIVMLERDLAKRDTADDKPTMPVIPKAVAIAIFREGMAYGASNVCDEIDNADSIMVEDSDHVGNFEVSFSMYVDLTDHLNLDFLSSAAVDNADEEWVVDCLKTLCSDKGFECRIHGVDDQGDDSKSA